MPKWRVAVDVQPVSRELLERHLGVDILDGPHDRPGLYLGHSLLDRGSTSDDVRELAFELIANLNGALALVHPGAPSITFQDRVCEITPSGNLGKCMTYMRAEATAYVLAWASPGSPSGRSPGQRAFDLIRTDPDFRSAATLFAYAGEDFQQLFIVAEFARDAVSGKVRGSWKSLEANDWVRKADLQRFKEVANRLHRHRPTNASRSMSGIEARDLVSELLRGWLDWKQPA